MKKLFFFRSSSSSNGNNNSGSVPSIDKQVHWEMPLENELNGGLGKDNKGENGFPTRKGLFSKSRKQAYENSNASTASFLRRSRSMSSTAFLVDEPRKNDFSCIDDQCLSPTSSISSAAHHQYDHPSWRRSITPERRAKAKRSEVAATIKNSHGQDGSGSSKYHSDSSRSSSSSNASSKVLDRYIDGDQQLERSKLKSSQRNFAGSQDFGGRLPPRVQYTAPASPMAGVKDKTRSYSFREAKGTHRHLSSREWVDNGFVHESPRTLAKNVIDRLSQMHSSDNLGLKEFNHDVPITIEDIYGGSLNQCFDPNSDDPSRKSYSLDEPYETHDYRLDECLVSKKELGNNFVDLRSVQTEDAVDAELQRRSKEAEERVILLSKELEQECFIQDSVFDVPSLVQTVRNLMADKLSLAIEVSGLIVSRITEGHACKGELRFAQSELESRTQRLEKEKSELQTALEKELDRRSSEYSSKLEKYQLEEQRLRDRVRELAEQNVSLQREVSSFNERETESRTVIAHSEQQLGNLSSKVEEVSKENHNLRENCSELQEKYAVAEEDLNCIKRNFKEKDKECKELQKTVARLLRTCSEQGKTIEGLRDAFSEEVEKKQSLDKSDKYIMKLQMEQMRLTSVELALRREVECHRIEIDSLRQENIILLTRLKGKGEEISALTFKLDKEIWTRICCLQSQGLPMLKESVILCSKLLEFIKAETCQFSETKGSMELGRSGLDSQFLVEADIKVQGFKRGTENLERSLQTISSLLQEKSNPVVSKFELPNNHTLEDALRCELKAETLLTTLLREKLYSKESEIEQLQAELAAAARGNDILRSEIQNAMDNLSCASHKLKDFELQMQKKNENVSCLQNNLQDSLKELTVTRGILSKVSEERDMMWEEVKQYNEKNMLLNSEVSILKKKIETLDEDVLLKEGQITILKDTISSKPFDIFSDPDYTQEFLLK